MINLDTFVASEVNGKEAAALANRYERVLQHIMQVLGPDIPLGVDYTLKENMAGVMAEVEEALRSLRAAGITFRRRHPSRNEALALAKQAAADGKIVIGNAAAATPGAVIVKSYVRYAAETFPEDERGVLELQWSRSGVGFGCLTLTTEAGRLRADTECMSVPFCLEIIRQALEERNEIG